MDAQSFAEWHHTNVTIMTVVIQERCPKHPYQYSSINNPNIANIIIACLYGFVWLEASNDDSNINNAVPLIWTMTRISFKRKYIDTDTDMDKNRSMIMTVMKKREQ